MTKLYILICAVFFTSSQAMAYKEWTSDDYIIPNEYSLISPKTITSEEVKEDIDYLIFALENGYSGKKYLPGTYYSDAIQALRKISEGDDVENLHEKIDQALYLIPDNHLSALYNWNYGKKRTSEERVGKVGKKIIKDHNKVWEVRNDQLDDKKVLYISINRFPIRESIMWDGFLETVSSHLSDSDSIVLDMRGNSGGYDTIGMEFIELLFGHSFEHPIKTQFSNQSPVAEALALNDIQVNIVDIQNEKGIVPEHLVKQYNHQLRFYNRVLAGEVPAEFIRTGKGGGSRSVPVTGYKKPIYILMDADCGSSCEYVIAGFQWHEYAITVGENTSGTFHFSNAGLAVLPNSKIMVNIPSQYSEYFDKRLIERIGLTPDINVPAGEDAYDAVKKILNAH